MEPQEPNQNMPNTNSQPPVPPTPAPAPAPQPAPAPAPQPASAPAPQPTPEVHAQPTQPTQPASQPDRKRLFVIISIAVAAVIAVVAILLVVFFLLPALTQGGSTPTLERAQQTCAKYGGDYQEEDVSNSDASFNEILNAKMVSAAGCMVNNDDNNIAFEFGVFENNLSDASAAKSALLSLISVDPSQVSAADEYVVTLEENQDFYKGYFQTGSQGGYYFLAAYKNTVVMLMTPDITTAEDILTSLGYPDRSHADANATVDNTATSQLQVSQQNTQIRNDLATVSTQFISYEANNRGQLPALSADYVSVDDTNAASSGEIGVLYTDYLNGTEEFINPLGDKYVLKVYNSLAAAPFATDTSTLVGSPANEIYVIYGAKCDNTNLVEAGPRNFAILSSLLGDAGLYCSSN